ncbi:hypothetical protein CKO25_16520 [Thiocapsa imhoffii]|uniref:BREX-2 system phosphatase PglZ n=1 Tax=Thiocapsa imhoffii TaxID=382777 RepID=A0A9X1BAS2_9GAMM|nr:BREX-2 system phosphatase PglZ [Thiocapsa imhoffii]MBK1646221.1 hypothetical protein [Thiocapsa imhoffii]
MTDSTPTPLTHPSRVGTRPPAASGGRGKALEQVPNAVLTQVQAILAKDAAADCIALLWPDPLPAGELHRIIADTPLRLVSCVSELAMRELLVTHQPGAVRLVMVTPLDETRLAKDVLARLWGCEPKRISPWRTLEQLLRVRQIDPRLLGKAERWMAEALVDGYERYRGRLRFGEVLDLDLAWRALALAWLDFASETLDLEALLDWSLSPAAAAAVAALPTAVAEHLEEWLRPRLGTVTELVLSLWRAGAASDMVAFGLVCTVLYREDLRPDQALFQGRGRLSERLLGGARIPDRVFQDYGRATVETLQRHAGPGPQAPAVADACARAEQILASLDLLALAEGSDWLPAAFGQRLDRLAATLKATLTGKPLDPALDTLLALRRHQLAAVREEQLATAALALRMCRWLRTDDVAPRSVTEAIREYVTNGADVDWARSRLWLGDAHDGLSRVYATLMSQARARRERFNQHFAESLPAIARGDQSDPGFQPIERALAHWVAPLAKQQPVLVLVLDGMSHAVYRELTQDLLGYGWVELQPVDQTGPCCLLAALPTLTHVSRFALLSGTLGEGTATNESKAFAAHPSLQRVATKQPPLLLHKAALQQPGSGALADGVRDVLAGHEHRVVGAVINAVDDQLSSGAQVSVRWSLDTIGLLPQILEAVRESGRLLILTSDHGHVLEHDLRMMPSSGESQRCKPATDPVAEGEVRVAGARVVAPGQTIILPWSEQIRYGAKKMGYHGGGSPQEVLVPFGVYRYAGDAGVLTGWREVPRQTPPWWRLVSERPEDAPTPPPPTAARRDRHTPDLFATLTTPVPPAGDERDWIAQLLASPVYARMQARAGRVRISDAQLRQLLTGLEQAGGQQMAAAVAQGLELPELRLHGLLAGVQKLLNVDGYPVLAIDRASKTVRLDLVSLKNQFELH